MGFETPGKEGKKFSEFCKELENDYEDVFAEEYSESNSPQYSEGTLESWFELQRRRANKNSWALIVVLATFFELSEIETNEFLRSSRLSKIKTYLVKFNAGEFKNDVVGTDALRYWIGKQNQLKSEKYQPVVTEETAPSNPRPLKEANEEHEILQTYFKWLKPQMEKIGVAALPYFDKTLSEVEVDLQILTQELPSEPDKFYEEIDRLYWEEPLTIFDVLDQHDVFIIQGYAGSGKTTCLKQLAFRAIQPDQKIPKLPIYIRLRDFSQWMDSRPNKSGADLVIRFLQSQFEDDWNFKRLEYEGEKGVEALGWFFHKKLSNGECMILFDGLDEIPEIEQRSEALLIVIKFIQTYRRDREWEDRNKIAIASRPGGLKEVEERLNKTRLTRCQVMPLSRDKRRELITNYIDSEETADGLIKKLEASSGQLARISGTPLFCAILARIYKEDQTLPSTSSALFDQILTQIIRRDRAGDRERLDQIEEESPFYYPEHRELAELRIRQVLRHLAWEMMYEHYSRRDYELSLDTVIDYINDECRKEVEGHDRVKVRGWAKNFLRVVESRFGLYIPFGGGEGGTHYDFAHRQFKEQLTAEYLIFDQSPEEKAAAIKNNGGAAAWEEVIKLYLSNEKLPKADRDQAVDILIELEDVHTTALAAEGLLELGVRLNQFDDYISQETLEKLAVPNQKVGKLYSEMIDVEREPKDRFRSGHALDALGWQPDDLHQFIPILDSKKVGELWGMKYLITNLQFEPFVLLGGYNNKEGWDEHLNDVTQPYYWNDLELGRERRTFPVVGVSWYEADGYGKWLTQQIQLYAQDANQAKETWQQYGSGRDVDTAIHTLEEMIQTLLATLQGQEISTLEIRLPNEAEWVCLAWGDKDERYTWDADDQVTSYDTEEGQKIIDQRANINNNVGSTSPVSMYPDGAYLHGLMDIAGNVWEWNAEWWEDEEESEKQVYRVLRGGSWAFNQGGVRVSYRLWGNPLNRLDFDGFRLVVVRPPSQ